jgi:hypothetical protein
MCWRCFVTDLRVAAGMGDSGVIRQEVDALEREDINKEEFGEAIELAVRNGGLSLEDATRYFRHERLGPVAPSPRTLMEERLASEGKFLRVHPDDVRGFRKQGVNAGFRAWILTSPDGEVTESTPEFYVKNNSSVDVAQAEVAAYMLSELLGLGTVPYTFRCGAFTFHEWVDDAVPARDAGPDYESSMAPALQKMSWFDYLTDNGDRHGGNYLVRNDMSGIVFIDHGYAFSSGNRRGDLEAFTRRRHEYPFYSVPAEILADLALDFPEVDIRSLVARHSAAVTMVKKEFSQLTLPF